MQRVWNWARSHPVTAVLGNLLAIVLIVMVPLIGAAAVPAPLTGPSPIWRC